MFCFFSFVRLPASRAEEEGERLGHSPRTQSGDCTPCTPTSAKRGPLHSFFLAASGGRKVEKGYLGTPQTPAGRPCTPSVGAYGVQGMQSPTHQLQQREALCTPFFLPPPAAEEKKKSSWGHPKPRQGDPAPLQLPRMGKPCAPYRHCQNNVASSVGTR
jgi:hypothetical protein